MDPTKKELYSAKRPSGLNISDPDVLKKIERLKSDADGTNWLLLKIKNVEGLSVHAHGEAGFDELHSSLSDDDVFYGAIRCMINGKVKFYHIFFVGVDVSGMKKGKASLYKSSIFGLIDAHGEISCSDGLPEFSRQHALALVSKLAGCPTTSIVM